MKKLIYYLIIISVIGCNTNTTPPKPLKKPFVITHKFPESDRCKKDYCGYDYTDANGTVVHFCEDVNMYMIGDTIY